MGYKNPSHFILNVYALNEYRYSSMKERLLREKPESFFQNLESNLKADIEKHYQEAKKQKCREVIWSNEGLYLLNSVEEYRRLFRLFSEHSSSIIGICCYRDVESYRESYRQQLLRQGFSLTMDRSSYRYLEKDSWLCDYDRKSSLLEEVFDETITFKYNKEDNVKQFIKEIHHLKSYTNSTRENITPKS